MQNIIVFMTPTGKISVFFFVKSLSMQNVMKISNDFLHEISVIFHEPSILLRALADLSVKTQDNMYV